MWRITVLLVVLLAQKSLQQHGRQIGTCTWENEDGSVLDLTSIGNQDGTPKWSNMETLDREQDPNMYFLNPCHGFNQGNGCQNVAACRISNLGATHQNIGNASRSNMYFSTDENTVVLDYKHNAGSITYISRYVIACPPDGGQEDQIVVSGHVMNTFDTILHRFILVSPCACPDGCLGITNAPTVDPTSTRHAPYSLEPASTRHTPYSLEPASTRHTPHSLKPASTRHTPHSLKPAITTVVTPGTKSLSAGGIICIIFVCALSAYFIFGAIYMIVIRGARGTEIVPNVSFWQDLPILIVDGFSFLSHGCKHNTDTEMSSEKTTEYDRI